MDEPLANNFSALGDGIAARFQLRFSSAKQSDFSLDVDLQLPAGGITAIFGRSGSGKTTLLRCIAGLYKAEVGNLAINGQLWQSENIFVPTHRRPLGYVFQEASLFAHLTALGNLRYAIKRADTPVTLDRFDHIVDLMGIETILNQYPQQLSGGERQRVAIARALLINPRLLLMDEPLSSLDAERKREILPYLEKLREELNIPILYVSHAIEEVTRLANYLVVLEQGKVMAQGALSEVLPRLDLPIRLGEETGVVLEAKIVERDLRWHLAKARFAGGDMWFRDDGDDIGSAVRIRILARDVSLSLASHDDSSIVNRLQATVAEIVADNDDARALVRLRLAETDLLSRVTWRSVDHLQLQVGMQVWALIKSVAIVK